MSGESERPQDRKKCKTSSICIVNLFLLLVWSPCFSTFSLTLQFLHFVPILVVFWISPSSSLSSPIPSCFWSLFWCLVLDVFDFAASSAGVSLCVRQLFCLSSFYVAFVFLLSVLSCGHLVEYLSLTSSASLFFSPPPQQFCPFW